MSWRLPIALAATLFSACATTPADSASCLNIANEVSRLISTSLTCTADADCICYAQTACGLYGECGEAINRFGQLQLDQLIAQWHDDCPNAAASCGNCSLRSTTARCSANRCECA